MCSITECAVRVLEAVFLLGSLAEEEGSGFVWGVRFHLTDWEIFFVLAEAWGWLMLLVLVGGCSSVGEW